MPKECIINQYCSFFFWKLAPAVKWYICTPEVLFPNSSTLARSLEFNWVVMFVHQTSWLKCFTLKDERLRLDFTDRSRTPDCVRLEQIKWYKMWLNSYLAFVHALSQYMIEILINRSTFTIIKSNAVMPMQFQIFLI